MQTAEDKSKLWIRISDVLDQDGPQWPSTVTAWKMQEKCVKKKKEEMYYCINDKIK